MFMDASTIYIKDNYYIKLINIKIINNVITGFLVFRNTDQKIYLKEKLNIKIPDLKEILNGKILETKHKIADKEYNIKLLYNKEKQKLQLIFGDFKQILELN